MTHVIFYIDLLGFSAAVRAASAQHPAILELLADLAALRGDFDLIKNKTDSGQSFNIRAAVSTFSDHIVISCPTGLLEQPESVGLGSALILAEKLISVFAARAIDLGLLIRGGATVGPLYHQGGVILGEALIEAYELESRVANYPRIVVSRKLYSRVESGFGNLLLFKDDDGITHFDYVRQMILRYGAQGEHLATWVEGVRRTATENIDRFEREERWNEFSKWIWFRNMLDRSRRSLPDALFQ